MSELPEERISFAERLAKLFASADLIDLTATIAEDLPSSWPSHVPFQQEVWNWFAPVATMPQAPQLRGLAPYQTRWSMLDDHAGTHVDAPTHWIPPSGSGLPHAAELGDMPGESIPLEPLFGPAAVINRTVLTGTGEPV